MGSIGLSATAQIAQRHTERVQPNTKFSVNTAESIVPQNAAPKKHSAARTTATAFYTQDFAGGLPAGWSVTGIWRYATAATTTPYSVGAIHSTTAANGWMLFNADSVYTASPTTAPTGYLQTAAINCTGHTSVRLNFQELYRNFYDSTVIWVSTSPTFTTYTRYAIGINDAFAPTEYSANPENIHINITPTAASQPAVYIRFYYYGRANGAYSWLIDDINLSELDPHDVQAHKSFLYNGGAAYGSSIFNTPLAFVDSVYPVTFLTNLGSSVENVDVNANIYNGSTSIYSQNYNYSPLVVNALDTLVQIMSGFKPTAIGSYTMAVNATITGDVDLTNNMDTVKFNVTDSIYQPSIGNITSAYYVHRVAGTSSALSVMQGTRFDIPPTATPDTISGFGVGFASSSVATGTTGEVTVQLYSVKDGDAGWTYIGTSFPKHLTAADFSPAGPSMSNVVWSYFAIDAASAGGLGTFVVDTNTSYAALVQTKNVNSNLLILATDQPKATPYSGYFGQSDSSLNDGGFTSFGFNTIATGQRYVPLVRLYFGHPDTKLAVENVNSIAISTSVSPNPASNEVKVAFAQANAANAVITLTNTVGQVVATQSVSAATSGSATFNTAALPAGVYFYSVMANGERSTGRVAIAH